jgi:hypothetical protein
MKNELIINRKFYCLCGIEIVPDSNSGRIFNYKLAAECSAFAIHQAGCIEATVFQQPEPRT